MELLSTFNVADWVIRNEDADDAPVVFTRAAMFRNPKNGGRVGIGQDAAGNAYVFVWDRSKAVTGNFQFYVCSPVEYATEKRAAKVLAALPDNA